MKIPFLDLHRQYKTIKHEVDKAIQSVLNKQLFILGDELQRFETEFSKYLGVEYAIGVSSGTDGLILALRALGISKNDEVITSANSFMATTLAIVSVGAIPILVDCDPKTYEIDIEGVKRKITKKTKAILSVDLYGNPCDILELRQIADKHKIYLIEDAAQAHGARIGNKKIGAFADVSVFSFYPAKNLGAYGDAGAVVTNKQNVYEKLIKLRNYGQIKKYVHEIIGYNNRLDEIQASILSVKLQYLDEWNKERNKIASVYRRGLRYSLTQKIKKGYYSCCHLFVIESNKRDELKIFLEKKGIYTLIHYPIPIHLQPCFSSLGYKKGDFPVTERLANRILSLPMYPELTKEEIFYVIEQVNDFERKNLFFFG